MLGVVGAVSMAVYKTVASVGVFLGSAVFFCGVDPSECLTGYKMVSLVIVLAGVIGYSVVTDKIRKNNLAKAIAKTGTGVAELVTTRDGERNSLLCDAVEDTEATESREEERQEL
ncbi:hypothetical protein KIPB_009860 [Kipferlia bialata]|uniref:Uncharacterized protein n=1 Tax=Kipferlia bialata TaxID=797122 RepID=A0A9K3D4J2_9EUKA|nr:hypothetical protein KIPB_009860 [Kipferlia bialata]|eukprot:g9860.t1